MFEKWKFWQKTPEGQIRVAFTLNPSFLAGVVIGGLGVWLIVFLF
jgi:hypothetical protein